MEPDEWYTLDIRNCTVQDGLAQRDGGMGHMGRIGLKGSSRELDGCLGQWLQDLCLST